MKTIARTVIAAFCLTLIALPATAQNRMPAPGPQGDRPTEEQRDELRRKMEAIRIARLTEELNLDEKTAAKFFSTLASLDQKRRTLLKENQEVLREMRGLMNQPQPDDVKLKAAINKIEKNQHEILALRSKEFSAVRENLTVAQQARYLLFHQEFQREMRGVVEGIREGAPRRGAPGMPPGQGRGPMRGAPPE